VYATVYASLLVLLLAGKAKGANTQKNHILDFPFKNSNLKKQGAETKRKKTNWENE